MKGCEQRVLSSERTISAPILGRELLITIWGFIFEGPRILEKEGIFRKERVLRGGIFSTVSEAQRISISVHVDASDFCIFLYALFFPIFIASIEYFLKNSCDECFQQYAFLK